MAIVLRFVDSDGFIRERFFDLVHVSDTRSMTLKKEISDVLSRNNLSIQNMGGQGCDGANNMHGEWNGLQALFSNECPFAYYIHCLAHRLQLALVAASREVVPVHQFFSYLTLVVNVVGSSCKRHDQLKAAQVAELERKLAIDDLETGSGLNQVGTLKLLRDIISDGASYVQCGDADGAYDKITSFEFIFILHLMREIMEITDDLCQALQRKSQDILNAMQLVSSTKSLIQKFREDGCDPLFEKVRTFCEKRKIEIPDMSARYTAGRGRSRHNITMEHYFRVEVFTATIDSQIQELRNRFQDNTMELLVLSSALDPYDAYKSFNIEDVCKLANKFYHDDFTEQEQFHLKFQLEHYECDIRGNPELQKVSTLSELCQVLVKTRKATIYPLVDRLIRLVLTLPISTASTERAFSAMKHVKTKLRNKMDDEFLANYLLTYIEKEIARDFNVDPIIDELYGMKERRAQLMMPNFSR